MTAHVTTAQWRAAFKLTPYIWNFKGRVAAAFGLLLAAKLANVAVPLVLKDIIDRLSHPGASVTMALVLVVLYGLLRFGKHPWTPA